MTTDRIKQAGKEFGETLRKDAKRNVETTSLRPALTPEQQATNDRNRMLNSALRRDARHSTITETEGEK